MTDSMRNVVSYSFEYYAANGSLKLTDTWENSIRSELPFRLLLRD
jgi:hypothetical protein